MKKFNELLQKQEELMSEIRRDTLEMNGVDLNNLPEEAERLMSEIKEMIEK